MFARKPYIRPPKAPVVRIEHQRGVMTSTAGTPCPKGVKAKPGKRAPTVEEKRWMDAIVAYGCVACIADGQAPRPTAVHHILSGGRRMGHLFTLPLCDTPQGGHHQNGAAIGLVSRHPFKYRFEQRYGAEMDLLAMLKVQLGFFDKWEAA